jgi:hypothetical protein
VFNRFRKRFRIGIATFGRARMIPAPQPAAAQSRYLGVRARFYGDVAPIDIATNPAFQMKAERNPVNELVLTYRAARATRIGYNSFEPGDTVEFVLSTLEAIRTAVDSARQMKGYLTGVVFFRWSNANEVLSTHPDEALAAAGGAPVRQLRNRIHQVDGRCAAVHCLDLYLESASPFSPKPLRYLVRGSTELEYFLPAPQAPVQMTGAAGLAVSLPPYCGRGRLYIGRAVAAKPTEFVVEELP